jgi:hypothetical protein
MPPAPPPAHHAPAVIPVSPLDPLRLLRCIAEVESGNKSHAIGPNGERGRYQMTRGTWMTYSPLPWASCGRDEAATDAAALACVRAIMGKLHGLGWPVTVARVAYGWRYGPGAIDHATRAPAPDSTAYQVRVANLYFDPTFALQEPVATNHP